MKTKFLFAFMLVSIVAFGQQNPIQIDANGLTQTLTAGGVVTRGQIVKINSAGQVVPVATTDTSGAIGVAATSQTSAGNGVSVSIQGTPLVQIDASGCTSGNIVSISSTTAGAGHCATTVLNQQIGVALSVSSPGSNFWNVTLAFGGGGLSSIGAATNVKTLGAVGNGKVFVDGTSNGSNNQLTSSQATFSVSDLNQNITCVSTPGQASNNLRINSTVTSFVNSSTITYGGANPGAFTGMECALTNPADPAVILSAFNACKSTFRAPSSGISFQGLGCNIYLPAGIYGLSATLDNLISTGNEACVGIIGDGRNKSVIVPTGSFTGSGQAGYVINGRCVGHFYKDFSVHMASVPTNQAGTSGIISVTGTNSFIENVGVYDFCYTQGGQLYGLFAGSGTDQMWINPTVVGFSTCPGLNGGLQLLGVSQATVLNPFLSNTNTNLQIANATSGANGSGIVVFGGVVDEGGVPSITNSVDVWLNGITLTGGANCLSVDATSFVWLTGGYCGTFGGGTGGGPTVASGGVLNMTQVHVNAVNAPSACYTSAAYGGIVDDGTNRCTTSGGGTVYPSGGIINKTSLSHAQANAFQTGTLAATTNLMSFAVDQPIAIQTLSWTPNNAFACTAGAFPTFSVSDGTVTATTSVNDTSASGTVTHTFPNTTASILNPAGTTGTVITIKVVTTGTCGTAPTNTQVNVWWQATAPGV